MNLLVLGNGFDLAHNLKTKYQDFLEWAFQNNKMGTYNSFDLDLFWAMRSKSKPYPEDKYFSRNYVPYFLLKLFNASDNWIDLENNIADIIEDEMHKLRDGKDRVTFKEILDKFILREFEQYIVEKINNESVKNKIDLRYTNRILSFNYSNTVERLYELEAEICYLNGKASLNDNESHIVFGYDPSDDYGSEAWCEYDKVHQRAYKNTDTQYKDWLKDENEYDIHIIGHSLGQTDRAFLRPFILKENSKTTVYYHNLVSKRQLIYRMMGTVGRETVDQENIIFKPIREFGLDDYTPRITVFDPNAF